MPTKSMHVRDGPGVSLGNAGFAPFGLQMIASVAISPTMLKLGFNTFLLALAGSVNKHSF